jgi:2-aminoadipate transaminase
MTDVLPDDDAAAGQSARELLMAHRVTRLASSVVRDLLAMTQRPALISFAGGLPAPDLFDVAGLGLAFERAITSDPRRVFQYSPTEGSDQLRTSVAERLTRNRLPSEPDDVLITTGSQQALALTALALVDTGSTVLVEEPTYLAALQALQLAGARVVGVPSDEEGLEPAALERVVKRERPAALYLVPNFANPTGKTLSAPRRVAIARLAHEHGFWVIEDDPYGELRFEGEAHAPLSSLPEAADRSVYLGSFSKIGAPGLRLGWLRAPEALRRVVCVIKQSIDLHTSTVDQAAATWYLQSGRIDPHVELLRAKYAGRRNAMLGALGELMPPGTTWNKPEGGMFVWLRLKGDVDTAEVLPRALSSNVAFVPGAAFYSSSPDRATMRLSFATHPPREIVEGLRRLALVLGAG